MGKAQTVIEINGKQYDASSGKVLALEHVTKRAAAGKVGGNIDGIHAAPRTSQHTSPRPKPNPHHKPEHSRTLMRSSVKKPATGHSKSLNPASSLITHYNVKEEGHLAKTIPKSPHISRFGSDKPAVKKVSQILPVKEPPVDEHFVLNHQPTAQYSLVNHKDKLVNKALEQATAHTIPKLKKTSLKAKTARRLKVSPRIVSVSTMSLAVLLLAGFFAYQNVPNFSMRLAASRSGVHANLPGYQPSGFSLLGPIQSKSGEVRLTYHSNSDDREFTVTQRNSGWSDETPFRNYVTFTQKSFQTYQSGNKDIYIYDGSNATWLTNGVWYQVEGKSNLSSEQLLKIADSM